MKNYVIGDVHGQKNALLKLLDKINYSDSDNLFFVGDLINRGPDSLGVLRLAQQLSNAKFVLGNHDYYLIYQKLTQQSNEILLADDIDQIIDWLRLQNSVIVDQDLRLIISHAGVFPDWKIIDILQIKQKIEERLKGDDYQQFILNTYGNESIKWTGTLNDFSDFRFALNSLARMRYLDEKKQLCLNNKSAPNAENTRIFPWFSFPSEYQKEGYRVIFGHWASLEVMITKNYACIDAGSGWGRELLAFDVDDWCIAGLVTCEN